MPELETILEKVPKKTPVWAVGIVTVLVSVATCLVTIYIVAKEDISKTLAWSQASYDARIKADDTNDARTIDGVLAIVSENMRTVSEINKVLGMSQLEASSLSARVGDLEKAVDRLKSSLSSCEVNLASCIASSKSKSIP